MLTPVAGVPEASPASSHRGQALCSYQSNSHILTSLCLTCPRLFVYPPSPCSPKQALLSGEHNHPRTDLCTLPLSASSTSGSPTCLKTVARRGRHGCAPALGSHFHLRALSRPGPVVRAVRDGSHGMSCAAPYEQILDHETALALCVLCHVHLRQREHCNISTGFGTYGACVGRCGSVSCGVPTAPSLSLQIARAPPGPSW